MGNGESGAAGLIPIPICRVCVLKHVSSGKAGNGKGMQEKRVMRQQLAANFAYSCCFPAALIKMLSKKLELELKLKLISGQVFNIIPLFPPRSICNIIYTPPDKSYPLKGHFFARYPLDRVLEKSSLSLWDICFFSWYFFAYFFLFFVAVQLQQQSFIAAANIDWQVDFEFGVLFSPFWPSRSPATLFKFHRVLLAQKGEWRQLGDSEQTPLGKSGSLYKKRNYENIKKISNPLRR